MLEKSSIHSLVPTPAKAGASHQNTMLIMREPLIVQEAESGRSWTSKVFNIVITLDTYQFFKSIILSWILKLDKGKLFGLFLLCKAILSGKYVQGVSNYFFVCFNTKHPVQILLHY